MASKIDIEKVCSFCRQHFIAHKTTTSFCSTRCAGKAYKERKRAEKVQSAKQELALTKERSIPEDIVMKHVLTPTEAAHFLGVGRATIYRYLQNNELPFFQTKGKTLIRKLDLDNLFNTSDTYQARPTKERKPITDFYTIPEIKEKFGVKENWIFRIAKNKKIPKTLKRGRTFFSKTHIDKHLSYLIPDPSITEWYSVKEIQEIFKLTTTTIYGIASDNYIPKKKEGKSVYYSKIHFDRTQGITPNMEYYTVQEVMNKYNLTRDMVYHHIKYNSITRVKDGRYIKISKTEFDKIFENPIIQ